MCTQEPGMVLEGGFGGEGVSMFSVFVICMYWYAWGLPFPGFSGARISRGRGVRVGSRGFLSVWI